ncbi:MAG: RNA polymerase sigma factor [bacterium]
MNWLRYTKQNRQDIGKTAGDLLKSAKNGDREAFGLVYKSFYTPIYRFIYFRVGDEEVAKDLTQTVFIKIFQKIEGYYSSESKPIAYFYRVARNTLIDHWRKNKALSLDALTEENENAEEISSKRELPDALTETALSLEKLRRAIPLLAADQQEVVICKFINQLSNEETALAMGKSEAAVRQLQCRALKALRRVLQEYVE